MGSDEERPRKRRLTAEEQCLGRSVLDEVRRLLGEKANGDAALLWALRRYVYIRLQHDERGNPMQRKILKLKKMVEQKDECPVCHGQLPERGAELDRFDAMKGYTTENTRLLCHVCHRRLQAERKFT